ncbi:hypothetical protein [Achromobacter sp. UMC71]|uniref:hypothetical protein n=1 Tax=Achromobacter sp. UMC71 TaxID=1862320 RepID=UPI001600CF83|nr:hypothetical protein [Achromobacter sp. UMC71]MBB1626947.1 hypothetical protein [Achromobacter sp. UMC71]
MFPPEIIALLIALALLALIALIVLVIKLLHLVYWACWNEEVIPAERPRLTGAILAAFFSTLAIADFLPDEISSAISRFNPIPPYDRETPYALTLAALTILSWIYGSRIKRHLWRKLRGARAEPSA